MENDLAKVDRRTRRWRRKPERTAISARLVLSDKLTGSVGKISPDLFDDLFSSLPPRSGLQSDGVNVHYIAITPWAPFSLELMEDATWTIIPVVALTFDGADTVDISSATVQVPASSPSLQCFGETQESALIGRGITNAKLGREIRALDVQPLYLDSIVVIVDGAALNRHDEVQKKFGGGFDHSRTNGVAGKGGSRGKAPQRAISSPLSNPGSDQEEMLATVTRRALALLLVIHQGDLLRLPLPSHPITHVPFPPAKIAFCEPCNQGLLSPNTKVIIARASAKGFENLGVPDVGLPRLMSVMTKDEEDETSNEQFFSAVEDKTSSRLTSDAEFESPDSSSSEKDSGSLSDDSLENVISISVPSLPTEPFGRKSTKTAATPKVAGSRLTGFDTPGSVYSNFTATTARQGSLYRGKLFQCKCLLTKISDDLIHPKPFDDEDEETRVFVDIKTLLRLGCFSGDWVNVEIITAPSTIQQGCWGTEAPGSEDGVEKSSRPVKIYGLPDISLNTQAWYPKGSISNKRSTKAYPHEQDRPMPEAWFSPILFANLCQPSCVKLSPLSNLSYDPASVSIKSRPANLSGSFLPPIAKEVMLLKIATPLATERALQKVLHVALQYYFETKRRVLRQGDLFLLPLDIGAGRILNRLTASSETDQEIEELLSLSNENSKKPSSLGVAWFRVKQIAGFTDEPESSLVSPDLWGGVWCVDSIKTRMGQAHGSEQTKLPRTLDNSWEYYSGIKAIPKLNTSANVWGKSLLDIPKPYISPLRRRLRELIAAGTDTRAVDFGLNPMVILLHSTQRSIGKATIASNASSDLGFHFFLIDAYDLLTEGNATAGDYRSEEVFKQKAERALSCGPGSTTILIRRIEALTSDRIVSTLQHIIRNARVLIATTSELEKVSERVRSLFTHEFEVEAPDEGEREGILRGVVDEKSIRLARDVDLSAIAVKTAALVAGDLVDVVERAIVARKDRLGALVEMSSKIDGSSTRAITRDILVSGGENVRCVTRADFDLAVDAARKNFADSIGAPKIPNVGWEDVGGLENVKDAVMETIQLPLERPELFAKGMKKRSGILFYGPPGTGKTLLAKAIATEFSLNFFSVKGPELLNMYIGESEANVRRVFQRARDARPCVVFFDELDSVAPKRGNQGDSGGVMDRIVSQLLAELDGMSDGKEGGGGVFVIGATNRPDLLDQALLRPGRFDKMLYLGVSDTHEKQLTILQALTRKFNMDADTSLHRVAESLPFTYSGADLYALCSDAMLKAITRQALAVDAKIKALPNGPVSTAYFFDHLATKADIAFIVTESDFFAAQRELVGSVRFAFLTFFTTS